jgi:hypothetical protein
MPVGAVRAKGRYRFCNAPWSFRPLIVTLTRSDQGTFRAQKRGADPDPSAIGGAERDGPVNHCPMLPARSYGRQQLKSTGFKPVYGLQTRHAEPLNTDNHSTLTTVQH